MPNKKKLRIGSKLIEDGKVYKVYKITEDRRREASERIIHFRPHYQNSINYSLICSIPECNLVHTDIRPPVSKKEMLEILRYLSKRSNKRHEADAVDAKSTLNLNNVYETAKVLKVFWREKRKKDVTITKTKKDILEMAINHMVEEVALVIGVSIDNAKRKIDLALKNYPN